MPFITFNLPCKDKTPQQQARIILYIVDALVSLEAYKKVRITFSTYYGRALLINNLIHGRIPDAIEKGNSQTGVIAEVSELLKTRKYKHLKGIFGLSPISTNSPDSNCIEDNVLKQDLEYMENFLKVLDEQHPGSFLPNKENCILGWANEEYTVNKPFAIGGKESALTESQSKNIQERLVAFSQNYPQNDTVKKLRELELGRLKTYIQVLKGEIGSCVYRNKDRKKIKLEALEELVRIIQTDDMAKRDNELLLVRPEDVKNAIAKVASQRLGMVNLYPSTVSKAYKHVKDALYAGMVSTRTATFLNNFAPKTLPSLNMTKADEKNIVNESKKLVLDRLEEFVVVLEKQVNQVNLHEQPTANNNTQLKINKMFVDDADVGKVKLAIFRKLLDTAKEQYAKSCAQKVGDGILFSALIGPDDLSQAIVQAKATLQQQLTFESVKDVLYNRDGYLFFARSNTTADFLKSIGISKASVIDNQEQDSQKQLNINLKT